MRSRIIDDVISRPSTVSREQRLVKISLSKKEEIIEKIMRAAFMSRWTIFKFGLYLKIGQKTDPCSEGLIIRE